MTFTSLSQYSLVGLVSPPDFLTRPKPPYRTGEAGAQFGPGRLNTLWVRSERHPSAPQPVSGTLAQAGCTGEFVLSAAASVACAWPCCAGALAAPRTTPTPAHTHPPPCPAGVCQPHHHSAPQPQPASSLSRCRPSTPPPSSPSPPAPHHFNLCVLMPCWLLLASSAHISGRRVGKQGAEWSQQRLEYYLLGAGFGSDLGRAACCAVVRPDQFPCPAGPLMPSKPRCTVSADLLLSGLPSSSPRAHRGNPGACAAAAFSLIAGFTAPLRAPETANCTAEPPRTARPTDIPNGGGPTTGSPHNGSLHRLHLPRCPREDRWPLDRLLQPDVRPP